MVRWRWRRRQLLALQVEVTSRCTRRCRLCPRQPLASRWREGDLPQQLWQRLRPDLRLAEHVHLQGWGEPLLHPQLREMVRDVHAAGCTSGITSNCDLLAEASTWIVAEGVALLTVSVAGGVRSHAELRSGSSLDTVLAAVAQVRRLRGHRRLPRVQVSYLLTRGNATDLPAVVQAAARAGTDELFVIHLDCTPSGELLAEAVFPGGVGQGVRAAITTAGRVARQEGIGFRPPALVGEELLACALAPPRFAAVGHDGRVGPCIYLLLPVDGPIPRWTGSGAGQVEAPELGRLQEAGLRQILAAEPWRRFCTPFEQRCTADERLRRSTDGLWGGVALASLARAGEQRDLLLHRVGFPRQCSGCHKVLGW